MRKVCMVLHLRRLCLVHYDTGNKTCRSLVLGALDPNGIVKRSAVGICILDSAYVRTGLEVDSRTPDENKTRKMALFYKCNKNVGCICLSGLRNYSPLGEAHSTQIYSHSIGIIH